MATSSSTTIANHYQICIEKFHFFCDAVKNAQQPKFLKQIPLLDAYNEAGRLRVWAGNLAAHRIGRSSLDHRLRQAGHLRQNIVSLLVDLQKHLHEG